MFKFSRLKSAFNVVSSKTAHFHLKHLFNALNILNALPLAYLTCGAMSDYIMNASGGEP